MMNAPPPVLLWSPAGPLAEQIGGLGFETGAVAQAGSGDDAMLLVDAREDVEGACAILRQHQASPVRVSLIGAVDATRQDALIEAGATQIAIVTGTGEGLAQALRLAVAAMPSPRDRRAGASSSPSALERWIDERLAQGEQVAVIHTAVVRLDLVNAAYGRDAGTSLLAAAERRIAAQVAAVAEDDGMVARTGAAGIAAAVARPADEAVIAAARIEEAFARPFRVEDRPAALGARVAIVGARPGESARALIARAAALTAEAEPPPGEDTLAVDIHQALARGEIAIVYQPQATPADNTITGVEALARWHHPALGLLGAEPLLAAAERAGLGGALSDHIQRRALAEVAAWPVPLAGLRVSINLTAADLARPGAIDTLLAHIDASGVARERLTIEVTETELMGDLDAAAGVLRAFQEAGCRTAIDDFGTGYSSLAYLATLPIDYLKLDRSLTRKATGSTRGQVVVRAAIDMARSLGIAVIAEGVETAAQCTALAQAGCAFYQGFLLAPPLSGSDLAAMMAGG